MYRDRTRGRRVEAALTREHGVFGQTSRGIPWHLSSCVCLKHKTSSDQPNFHLLNGITGWMNQIRRKHTVSTDEYSLAWINRHACELNCTCCPDFTAVYTGFIRPNVSAIKTVLAFERHCLYNVVTVFRTDSQSELEFINIDDTKRI